MLDAAWLLEWMMGEVIGAVEKVKEQKWEKFRDRHGDWGRDAALYVGRKNPAARLLSKTVMSSEPKESVC